MEVKFLYVGGGPNHWSILSVAWWSYITVRFGNETETMHNLIVELQSIPIILKYIINFLFIIPIYIPIIHNII